MKPHRFASVTAGSGLLALAMGMTGCAQDLLIRRDDPTFQSAQSRLQRTAQAVRASDASPEEATLFLQAEGLYRYRFTAAPKSALTYAAETAAATTDLPAFQSLAGSLNLADLRDRAPDASIQLWETLLAQHPQTPLRPLALYRLGWAYRSAGITGLPRASPEDALAVLEREQPDSAWSTWAQRVREVPYKTKAAALERSIVPGFGQFYVGDTRGGWLRFATAVAALGVVGMSTVQLAHGHHEALWGSAGFVGLVVLSFDFTASLEDASAGVVRWNERAEAEFEQAHPDAP